MSGNNSSGGWANPTPAGLVALSVAMICFFASTSGLVTGAAAPLIACWMLGGFVVQIIVAVIELREGSLLGGNVFTIFAAMFMLAGASSFFFKYMAGLNGWPVDTLIDGFAWAVLAVALIAFTPAYLKESPKLFGIFILIVDTGLVILALLDLHILPHDPWQTVFAYMCLVNTAIPLYLVAATVVNTSFGKMLLPVGKPFIKSK